MRGFLSLYAALVDLCFSIERSYLLSIPLLSRPPPTKSLEARQVPAVIATSEFLRRGYQASVVAGNWVYIDGGEFSFISNGTSVFQYASTLLSIDLSQNWTNATVLIQSTTKPSGAPNLNSPSLWYHESENLIYSGFSGWNSSFGNDPNMLPPLSLWTFQPDGSGSGAWNETIVAESSVWSQLTRPGEPLMTFGSDSAWVLGGLTTEWEVQYALPENLIPGMVQFDMVSRSFSNSSVQCCNATGGIYRGALQYVPSFGPEGIHIAMGGQNGIGNNGVTAGLIDFGTVSVFDPAKHEWWNQTTTGSEPSPRVEFCTAGINSTNGTYEIFVYAGWGTHLGPAAIPYDTINILTLPAFHWISIPYNPENPRHALSCNAVGGSQILTIGGVDSNAQVTGLTLIQEIVESTFNSSPDPFAQGLAIFDMTTMAFSAQFTAGAPPYEQSDLVKQFYSQSKGAYKDTLTPQVSALLEVTHFANTTSTSSSSASSDSSNPTTSRPSESNGLRPGAIAGIAVGSFAALLVIAAGIGYLVKKRTASQKSELARATSTKGYKEITPFSFKNYELQEMDGYGRASELQEQGSQELQGQGIQELEHPVPAVELQTYQHDRRD